LLICTLHTLHKFGYLDIATIFQGLRLIYYRPFSSHHRFRRYLFNYMSYHKTSISIT